MATADYGKLTFQVEIRPRAATQNLTYVASIKVKGYSEQAAIAEARRLFKEQNPSEDAAAYEFRIRG